MAETFTGLKLKGELGRFGKTEICDVLGVYPMPDEKVIRKCSSTFIKINQYQKSLTTLQVLSGCEWGNVLVWEAGLVKLEVTQRGRKTCHSAPVVSTIHIKQFCLYNLIPNYLLLNYLLLT